MAMRAEDGDLAKKAGAKVKEEALKPVKKGFTKSAAVVCDNVLKVTVENAIRETWKEAEKQAPGTGQVEARKYWLRLRKYFILHGRYIALVAEALATAKRNKLINSGHVCNATGMVIPWARKTCREWRKAQPGAIVPLFGCRGYKDTDSIGCHEKELMAP